ncbi:MAG TPA: GGDEF domain-containing protein [Tahibacter sp.]|uniref:GGDEF domain-containing protein n=1 Tax=Tahibacter sp. TaxID=2056211 RepID=UPI002B52594E|nr:GGDEF domain-containing protein [Tahibacter sp.]HSX59581.1 GGDEF domain-containing protein [Tahibacter sp.]
MSTSTESKTTRRGRIAEIFEASADGAVLMVVHGERFGHRIRIGAAPTTIGRGSDCNFRITDRSASRRHCMAWSESGRYWVRDLGSTNKTCVNDQFVTEAELKAGDYLTVGNTVFRLIRNGTLEARYHSGLNRLATIDALTQLPNRRHFRDLLDTACADARASRIPLCVLFVDLDHFKRVNDTFGHCTGDEVLRAIALLLRVQLGEHEAAGRLGGEEFALLLPHTPLHLARARAEQLRRSIAAHQTPTSTDLIAVTASIGIVEWGSRYDSVADLMHDADRQLYRAKALGRNRVCTSLEEAGA